MPRIIPSIFAVAAAVVLAASGISAIGGNERDCAV